MPGLLGDPTQGGGGLLGGLSNFLLNLNPSTPQAQAIIQQHIIQQQFQSLKQMPQFQGPGGDAMAMQAMQSPEIYKQAVGGDISTDPSGVTRRLTLGGLPQAIGQQATPYQKLSPGEGLVNPYAQQSGAPQAQAGAPSAPPSGGMAIQNTNGTMDQASLQNLVDRRLKGDEKVNAELGGGMGGGLGMINKAAYQKLLQSTMQAQGITPADLVARTAKFPAYEDALKTNAQVGTRMQTAQTEALGILPQLKAAAAATNPSDFPIWNQAKLAYMAHTGDPRSASLASYANAMINTYARGITTNPRGPTDSDKQHLRDVVDPYWSRGQWDAGAQAIQTELDIAHQAIGKSRNQIDVNYGFGHEPDPADVSGAQAALARAQAKGVSGADLESVKSQLTRRFEESGFNAPKF